jgi:hypothetical protein
MKMVYKLLLPMTDSDDSGGWQIREHFNGREQPIREIEPGGEVKYDQRLIEVRLSVRPIDGGGQPGQWGPDLIFDPAAGEFVPEQPGAPILQALREEE